MKNSGLKDGELDDTATLRRMAEIRKKLAELRKKKQVKK